MRLSSSLFAVYFAAVGAVPTLAAAPAAAPQYFVVCGSAPNQPTVYFSAVIQAQPAAFQQLRTGFADYLAQHFSYKGPVGCAPTNSAANAQKAVAAQSTALRNAKKNVVETGWTEGGGSLAAHIGATLSPATASVTSKAVAPSAKAPAAGRTTAAAGDSGGSSTSGLTSTLGTIFGTSGGCGGGNNAAGTGGSKSDKGKSAGGAQPDGTPGSSGCQSPYSQVSSTLTTLFSSAGGSASGTPNARGDASPGGAVPSEQEGLGSAEGQSTKLVVYGCGRHNTQVACVTDLTNENHKDTLVLSDVWKDSFIVDDRGDRHPRSKGVFVNIDGDQRSQLDIGYGKSARFVLMFDGVPPKVQKVTLRSASAGLDVEDISLTASGGEAATAQAH